MFEPLGEEKVRFILGDDLFEALNERIEASNLNQAEITLIETVFDDDDAVIVFTENEDHAEGEVFESNINAFENIISDIPLSKIDFIVHKGKVYDSDKIQLHAQISF